jgi:hypothetical protein
LVEGKQDSPGARVIDFTEPAFSDQHITKTKRQEPLQLFLDRLYSLHARLYAF